MKKILLERTSEILKNKTKLEKELKIKIIRGDKDISIDGKAEDEYIAEKVLEALSFGFSFSTTILIKKEDFLFEILNIKDYTKRNDLSRIKARIIGKGGKTLKTLSELSGCNFEINENSVGIIGDSEDIKKAHDAIISLIRGSKQANVYSRLEHQKSKLISDLGLR